VGGTPFPGVRLYRRHFLGRFFLLAFLQEVIVFIVILADGKIGIIHFDLVEAFFFLFLELTRAGGKLIPHHNARVSPVGDIEFETGFPLFPLCGFFILQLVVFVVEVFLPT
jgi:hypothetical protein